MTEKLIIHDNFSGQMLQSGWLSFLHQKHRDDDSGGEAGKDWDEVFAGEVGGFDIADGCHRDDTPGNDRTAADPDGDDLAESSQ